MSINLSSISWTYTYNIYDNDKCIFHLAISMLIRYKNNAVKYTYSIPYTKAIPVVFSHSHAEADGIEMITRTWSLYDKNEPHFCAPLSIAHAREIHFYNSTKVRSDRNATRRRRNCHLCDLKFW